MSPQRRALLLAAGLLLGAAVAFLIRDLVRALILTPLLYLLWAGRVIYDTLPQAAWWTFFIIGLLYLIYKSLFRRQITRPENIFGEAERSTRAQSWARLVEQSKRGRYFKWRLANQLSLLTLDIAGFRQRLTAEQALEALEAGELDLPPRILAYVRHGMQARSLDATRGGRWLQPRPGGPSDEPDTQEVLTFLENELNR